MTLYDWMRAGPAARGTPPRRHLRGRSLIAIGLLAALSLPQTGCQSGGCSNCGFLRRTTSRLFNRTASVMRGGSSGGSAYVGETVVSDAPVTYAAPSTVVVPGPPAGVPAGGSPVIEDVPSNLEPLPKAKIDKQGSTGSIPKTGYDSLRPPYRTGRPLANNNLAQTSTSGSDPVPASRSARGTSVESQATADNPLDRLPPLDLPTEVTERSQTPPIAPAAERAESAKPANLDKVDAKPAAKGQDTVKTEPDKSAGSSSSLPADTSSAAIEIPGIQRLVVVDIKLAGGSTPSTKGLDWLADKGYKTLLDLRESADVQPAFIAEVAKRGMRYVALPLSARTIDADHVARFEFELSTAETRPLYFFDSDGTRPGVMWYIRRITKDNFNPQIARRDAEDLGLKDKAFWLAATSFVEKATAAKIGQLPHDADLDPETTPASTSETQSFKPSRTPSASTGPITVPASLTDLVLPTITKAASSAEATDKSASPAPALLEAPEAFKNQAAWHPFAAIVMTGLTVPFAYWSRSMLPLVFTTPKASLPGVAQAPKSLPSESGG